MCGFAGIVNTTSREIPDRALLRRMAAAVRHRGPDEFGLFRDRTAGLAHARLSIIDLATGQQPLSNEDGNLWIAFNGEVYNYLELRQELEGAGHRFRTASDTEVVVHAYQRWGVEAFGRFNGQFAIAIWDRSRKRLVLARDRLGIRPLYHADHDGRFRFATEIKSLFADPGFPREIDPRGIDQVFTFWTAVAPVTCFRGIRQLPPGHFLVLEAEGGDERSIRPYWEPSFPHPNDPYPHSVEEAAEVLLYHLEEATRLRMLRSDVPVGSYLSGGIDSSVVAALGRRAKEGLFRTFSLRFADAEFDETPYQIMMAERLDSEHQHVHVTREDIAAVFPDVIWHTESPVLRTAPAPLFHLSRLVREHGFKVVLTGEGADEMLAGYDIFREAKVRSFWARDPASSLRPRLLERLYPYLARSPVSTRAMARKYFGQHLERSDEPFFSHEPRWSSAAALKRLFSPEMHASLEDWDAMEDLMSGLPDRFGSWDPLCRAQYLEMKTLLSGYLLSSQGDRMLMGNSVEGRFPFLDPDVVEFCNALPPRYKLRRLDEKHLLKRAARNLVPDPILTRPKQPYRAPDAPSFVGDGVECDYLDGVLAERTVRDAGIFEPEGVSRLRAKCRSRVGKGPLSNSDNMAFVGILSTQLLWDRFVRDLPAAPDPGDGAFTTRAEFTGGDGPAARLT